MGLLDLYGSDTFTDQQKAALQQRGLLGFLAGMQKSGALDYTAPFLSGKVPGGFAAGLAGGAGGMGEAQDSGALRAMQAQELGLKAQQLRANLGLQNEELNFYRNLQGGQGGAPNAAGPSTAGPGGTSTPTGGLLPSLVKGAESEGLANQLGISPYDIGFGGTDLSNAPKREDGFPIWEGKQGPAGISHAAGAYQFQPATWAQYAAPLGIKDFSQASQDKVFQAAVADKGLQPWMANPKIAALVNTGQFGGSGSSAPPQPAQQGLLAQPAPTPPAGGLLAQAGQGQPPMPSPQPQQAPAASVGMMPGGAIPGMGMTSQQAQYLSALQSLQGRQSPDFVNKTAGLPLVGPTAAATANAQKGVELQYAAPLQEAKNRADFNTKVEPFRPGGGMGTAATGPTTAMPVLHEIQNPDGSKTLVPVNPLTGQVQGQSAGAGKPVNPQTAANDATKGLTTKLSPATEEALKDSGKDDAKLFNDYRAMYLSNQSAKQDLSNAMEALQYVRSGTGAEMTNTVSKALRAMGIDVTKFTSLPQPAQLEIVKKASGRLLGGAVKSVVGGNRPALGEFDYLKNTVVNEETEPEAQRSVAGALLSTMNWQDSLFKEMQGYKKGNNNSPVGFDVADFGSRNPMPQYFGDAINSFAPLRGEQQLPQHANVPGVPPSTSGGPSVTRRTLGGVQYFSPDGGKSWYK